MRRNKALLVLSMMSFTLSATMDRSHLPRLTEEERRPFMDNLRAARRILKDTGISMSELRAAKKWVEVIKQTIPHGEIKLRNAYASLTERIKGLIERKQEAAITTRVQLN